MDINSTTYHQASRTQRRLMWLRDRIEQAKHCIKICDIGVGNGSNYQWELDAAKKALAKAESDFAEYALWLKKGQKQ